ncbi:aminotransferase-like domain-containing protein [Cupriavidus basilensis]|uniref:aminotransferase-like domain-containing protein n=1 Tax=Cupriavidus basilensis TaxID=68895 RepID=UPI00284FF29D|nr:PLP-dependent aminotransferase family protein [Cupriavidus basilensis]MDR3385061.1 PLP-dependent aminotransferase family protein [Cupriavidus basilensis]
MHQSKSIQDDGAAPGWAAAFVRGEGARYQQIVGFIERAVGDGRLNPGDRLPPQRELARQLGVDLTTVTRAFTEAKRRNLIEARGALGTFVAPPKVELAQMVDLSMNVPPPPAGVDFHDLLQRGLSQVLLRSDAHLLMTYQLGGGSRADRAAGAMWLKPVLESVSPQQLIACPGAQAALAALILTLTQPGEAILAEPLTYPGLRAAAEQLGRRVVTVATDDDGMRPDAMEQALREHGARTIYLNPTIQNPTTRTMPAHRRRDVALAAQKCSAWIIEDDPYWLLGSDAPPPVAHFAPGQVYYVATLSKCLSPGLRTAYIRLPEARSRAGVLAALRSFALMSTPLSTALATQWIHEGSAAQLLAGIRTEAFARRELARQLLFSADQAPPSGIHVWHNLPSYWTSLALTQAARAEDLRVTASDAFYAGPTPPNAIRISLGGVETRAHLAAALKKLAELLVRRPQASREIVV